jgi:hypothetical protein
VTVERLPLAAEAADLRVVAPPAVDATTVELSPPLASVPALPAEPAVEVAADDLAPAADVLPLALAEPPFAIRRPAVAPARPRLAAAELPHAELRHPPVAVGEVPVRVARPVVLLERRCRPTPPASLAPAALRAHLTALVRRAGAANAGDLTLVGVFERVPGGAIRSVAVVEGGVQLRLDPSARPRPASLAVARRRSTGDLVTAEVPT